MVGHAPQMTLRGKHAVTRFLGTLDILYHRASDCGARGRKETHFFQSRVSGYYKSPARILTVVFREHAKGSKGKEGLCGTVQGKL